MNERASNVAGQCRATASSALAVSILVDGGSGTLRELLLDAAVCLEGMAAALQQCAGLHRQMAPTSDQDYELWHGLRRALDGVGVALPSSAELRAELPLYYCRGKGGHYERIGYAKPAGAIKVAQGDSGVIVYRDVQDGALYFRSSTDFQRRMALVPVEQPAPAERQCATMLRPVSVCGCPDCGSSLVEWPVGIDSEGGSCD